jgi:hypothetical protein
MPAIGPGLAPIMALELAAFLVTSSTLPARRLT